MMKNVLVLLIYFNKIYKFTLIPFLVLSIIGAISLGLIGLTIPVLFTIIDYIEKFIRYKKLTSKLETFIIEKEIYLSFKDYFDFMEFQDQFKKEGFNYVLNHCHKKSNLLHKLKNQTFYISNNNVLERINKFKKNKRTSYVLVEENLLSNSL